MPMTGAELLRKAAGTITVPGNFIAASGLLLPEQADAFLDAVYDATPFSALQRTERRRSKSGTIAKIGIGSRLLRPKTVGVDDSTLSRPSYGDVGYQTVASRLDWEIDEEVFEENIEGPAFEDHVVRLMAEQVGRDLEDLHFNGDTADVSADAAFLTQNDGWLKQIETGGIAHRIDGSAINAGDIEKGHFFRGVEQMPNKYLQQGTARWLASPTTWARYVEYLTDRATGAGDSALISGQVPSIAGIAGISIPVMPNDRLVLADPRNFIVVNTRDIRRRRTTEGREAIRADKRFYAMFLDDDPIIEEQDGIVDVYGLTA